jgi:hypothetical protein
MLAAVVLLQYGALHAMTGFFWDLYLFETLHGHDEQCGLLFAR